MAPALCLPALLPAAPPTENGRKSVLAGGGSGLLLPAAGCANCCSVVAVAPVLHLPALLLATENGRKPVLAGGGRGLHAAGCAKERMLLVLEVAVLLLALVVAPERNRTLKKTRRQSSRTQQKFSSCCYQARKQVYNNQPRFIPLKWAAKSAIPLVVVVALLVFTTRRFSSWVSTFQER